jgi:phosphinothricin acetyltransferase
VIRFENLEEKHKESILNIFNYWVDRTNYAYPQTPMGDEMYTRLLDNAKHLCGYAIVDKGDEIIGFCQLKPFNPQPTFAKTVEITYFLEHKHLDMGIGKLVLEKLMDDAQRLRKTQVLASVSGENARSLRFHAKNGFIECGRFKRVGNKFGRDFDIVYFQKEIS